MQKAVDFLVQRELVFQRIIDQHGLPVIPSRPQGFATLVLLILEQQVSIDSAKATYLKIQDCVEDISPKHLILLTDEQYRALGVSRQKTSYIKGLAQKILDQTFSVELLAEMTADQARNSLIQIKGIGHWTIDVYLMFALQAPDIIPLGDIAVVNTFKELFDIHTKELMCLRAQEWQPYRSMATYLLWHHYLRSRGRQISYTY
ncbi:DNA-3-methyladenine glycosylase 2 family protein [Flavobacterium sp. CYK-55]|uniref:DNA-3-methyladenine glycosylase family protein n=1 Tax=Flavobacterium sp. CYK-55 TaxID=2835529 RepID=UPI001BD184BA|nr:DNA-3-methyladenine glycosylase 2 family protein [Flavobacterium sp. CYK-55]MBS7787296.1 DNA-3-methyladenine glycosylase 2 family protein [Flavobacterium sp. CYK-55]